MSDKDQALGGIPSGWSWVPIRDLCTILSGGTPPKSIPSFWTGDIPWVSGKDLKSPRLTDSIDHISEEGLADGSRLAPAGAVFVLVRGMGLARDLPVAVATRPMAFNQDIKALVTKGEIPGAFIRAAIYHARARLLSRIVPAAHGTMTLNLDDIETFMVGVPAQASEAQEIAQVLDVVMDAKDQASRGLLTAVDLKRAAMRTLFSRGISDAPQQETEFGPVPETWEIVPLDGCAFVQTGAAKGRRFGDHETVEVPYLRVANVQDGHLDLTEMKKIMIRKSEVERYRLQDGDVVLTEGGDFDKLGRGFIWRGQLELCVHQNHVFAVRTQRERLMPDFLAYQAQSHYGKAYFLKVAHKTTNLACINTAKLKAFPALIPKLDEQRKITEILEAIDRKINLYQRKCALLDELSGGLLHKLMTGDIRVADLDLSGLAPVATAQEVA